MKLVAWSDLGPWPKTPSSNKRKFCFLGPRVFVLISCLKSRNKNDKTRRKTQSAQWNWFNKKKTKKTKKKAEGLGKSDQLIRTLGANSIWKQKPQHVLRNEFEYGSWWLTYWAKVRGSGRWIGSLRWSAPWPNSKRRPIRRRRNCCRRWPLNCCCHRCCSSSNRWPSPISWWNRWKCSNQGKQWPIRADRPNPSRMACAAGTGAAARAPR